MLLSLRHNDLVMMLERRHREIASGNIERTGDAADVDFERAD